MYRGIKINFNQTDFVTDQAYGRKRIPISIFNFQYFQFSIF